MNKDTLAIQKRIRIELFNIGTNPKMRGVIFFQAEQKASPTLKRQDSDPEQPLEDALDPAESKLNKLKLLLGQKQLSIAVVTPKSKTLGRTDVLASEQNLLLSSKEALDHPEQQGNKHPEHPAAAELQTKCYVKIFKPSNSSLQ